MKNSNKNEKRNKMKIGKNENRNIGMYNGQINILSRIELSWVELSWVELSWVELSYLHVSSV